MRISLTETVKSIEAPRMTSTPIDRDVLLELALNSANAACFEVDTVAQLLTWDHAFQDLFGFASKPIPRTADFRERIDRADFVRVCSEIEDAIRQEQPVYETELRIYTSSPSEFFHSAKEPRWIYICLKIVESPAEDAPGYRLIGIARDVTDSKKKEEQVRESRTKITTLLNCIPQLIWTTSATGQHLYANSRCLGYTSFDRSKRNLGWIHAIHPDDAKEVIAKWNTSIASGEIFEAEYRLRDANGIDTWFLGRAVPLKDENGNVTEWFGTATDIHDKKQAEAKRNRIQRKVAQLEIIASALAIAHKPLEVAQLVVDQGLKAVDADVGFIVLTQPRSDYLPLLYASGYTSHQLDLLKSLTVHSKLPVAEAVRTRESVFLVGDDKLEPYEATRSGFALPRRHAIAALPLIVQGQALGALTLGYNSAQEFTEERIGYLTILAEQCAQAIERARLFEAEQHARRRAELASRAKTQFLTNMSHEIRTPMNSILGFADMLGDKSLSPEEREDYRSRIRMNGDQLMRLIDDVLELSKADSGKIELNKTKFSILDLVREIHGSVASVTKKKEILTRITTDASVPRTIESDPVRLRQILTNLIGNSIKFTDHGRIETRISVVDSKLLIEVEDTGIGISPELHQRLFQPFVQGDSSVTRRFGGSGLGLVVSRNVAEAMGGSLELVRSDSGHGSIFRLAVPLPAPALQDPQINLFDDPSKNSQGDRRELEGVQVLLVEDSIDNEMLIRAYLKGTGVQLEVAHNGLEAVDRALDRSFDMVFMDIQMPVMDGLEATRRLKDKNYDKPIVALSAHALPEEVERSLAAGCHSHLTKPIPRNVLIDQIRSLRPT